MLTLVLCLRQTARDLRQQHPPPLLLQPPQQLDMQAMVTVPGRRLVLAVAAATAVAVDW